MFILCFAKACLFCIFFSQSFGLDAKPKVNIFPLIKDKDLPVCRDCKHFLLYKPENVQNIYTYRLGHCSLFGKKDYISGHISYEYADHCRLNPDQCSMKGIFFEPMKPSTTVFPVFEPMKPSTTVFPVFEPNEQLP